MLRNLHNKPEYTKPKLRKAPEWLDEEDINLSAIRDLIKQIKGYNGGNSSKADFLIRRAVDEFSHALKSSGLPLDKPVDEDLLIKRIEASKPLRDYFIDYFETLIEKDLPVGEIAADFFESLHNNVMNTKNLSQYFPANLEFYFFFIWESFICTTAILLHFDKYGEINKMLVRTYYLNDGNRNENSYSYVEFKKNFPVIEECCKPKSGQDYNQKDIVKKFFHYLALIQ